MSDIGRITGREMRIPRDSSIDCILSVVVSMSCRWISSDQSEIVFRLVVEPGIVSEGNRSLVKFMLRVVNSFREIVLSFTDQ
jgi:hypothetical protein